MAVIVSELQDKLELPPELERELVQLGEYLLGEEGFTFEVEISIVLVDDYYIQRLNRDYRGKDSATDVLAFLLQDEFSEDEEENTLGDVFISTERASEQAAEAGHGTREEILYLAAHGILHLFGYDDSSEEGEQVMHEKQVEALANFQKGR